MPPRERKYIVLSVRLPLPINGAVIDHNHGHQERHQGTSPPPGRPRSTASSTAQRHNWRMDSGEAEANIPAWISKLGIVDRATGIDAARTSRQQLFDTASAALAAFRQAGGATVPNLLLLGLAYSRPRFT